MAWSFKHVLDDFLATLTVIHFLDHTLVDGLALTTKSRRKLESCSFGLRHDGKLLHNWLNELNSTGTSFDMMIVVMTILFNTVESIFVLILAMRNEPRILRFPSGMRSPFVIEHAVAQLIATTARLLSLSLREQTVAWTK
jgi:hypothetical protein